MWQAVAAQISAASGEQFELAKGFEAGGGCINSAARIQGTCGRVFFIKFNHVDRLEMFEAEVAGLWAIKNSETLAVPEPVCTGSAGDKAFLVLENLELGGHGDDAELARQLAAMHRYSQPQFGWYRDNTIGATLQRNPLQTAWLDFWRDARLGFQLSLARNNGAPKTLLEGGERLMAGMDGLFSGYRPSPSLLHGDLWGGNYGYANGRPVVYDPAVYFGDREADLAMTELFGGFSRRFYDAYQEAWPLDPGYKVRKSLYNVYHVINHFNLFGGSYASQAERMVGALLAEIG